MEYSYPAAIVQIKELREQILQLLSENAQLRADVEKYKDWCRKLIESGKFPGEIDNPLN